MIGESSRYAAARAFDRRPHRLPPFHGIRPRPIGRAEGIIEHVLREGDRLDLIARHYYNDDRLWWWILDANPQILFGGPLFVVEGGPNDVPSEDPESDRRRGWAGQTILIPAAPEARR